MYDPARPNDSTSAGRDVAMRDASPENKGLSNGTHETPYASTTPWTGPQVHNHSFNHAAEQSPGTFPPLNAALPSVAYNGGPAPSQTRVTPDIPDRNNLPNRHPSLSRFSLHNNTGLSPESYARATPAQAEMSAESRSSASQSMSISAMLSNPVSEVNPLAADAIDPSLLPAKPAKRAYRRKNAGEASANVKKPKAQRTGVRMLLKQTVLTAQSDVKDTKKRKDGRHKPRNVPEAYDIEWALYDTDFSEPSDDEEYAHYKHIFDQQWADRLAAITNAEAVSAKRRRVEASERILSMLDRRVRKSQKAFEARHQDAAFNRATFEDGIRKQVQKLESQQQKTAKAKEPPMAPPSNPTKKTKKRKRDSAALGRQEYDDADIAMVSRTKADVGERDALYDLLWKEIAKKEVPKVYRLIQVSNASRALNTKKTTQLCAKEARRWQFRTNKTAKDMLAKSKRAMREMLIFWKKNERGDLLNRQKAEKELIDKAKKEEESRESRRQARKLNFLITQTELYSHFIGNKIKTAEAEQSEDTTPDANRLLHPAQPQVPLDLGLAAGKGNAELDFDADDDDALRAVAARNAQEAIVAAKAKAQGFDHESGARIQTNGTDAQANVDAMDLDFQNPTTLGEADVAQPKMLNATLKEYQLKGLNWLVNLYEQGINGILADEMGLGKTVQSISVMAHLAETYNIWGPFLVIAPASTLHNWQQEISRFVPRLKALPYWGSQKDRKVLRKFWDRKRATYTEDAPFHVVVTSYQLVVQDSQYFQNVKWQYMILDEAQAIKSSQSSRWKNLLAFKCRNRLLLTGTPIQNTMQELWALLHFIMPSLFDSHNEFSEWFSKDIENHAQRNSELNETQLRRLHMILKPFMLRRVKKNVQKELGDKIELDVFCDLNMRQRSIYSLLRKEISMKDIIEKAASDRDTDLSSLMNLVMQLRKVCNHPDLFERADVITPFAVAEVPKTASLAKEGSAIELAYAATSALKYELPKLVYQEGIFNIPSQATQAGFRAKYFAQMFCVFAANNIADSLKTRHSGLAWSRFANLSPGDIETCFKHPLHFAMAARRSSLEANYLLDSVDTPQAMLRMLRLYRDPGSRFSSSNPPGLLTIRSSKVYEQRLMRLDPMYDPRAVAPPADVICSDYSFIHAQENTLYRDQLRRLLYGLNMSEESAAVSLNKDCSAITTGLLPNTDQDKRGYGNIRMPSMQTFITDSGKLAKLDELLSELKKNDHRVLLYFQMTKMIDLMEEYLVFRQYKYLRLDGSSKISDRRDMVNDWQTRPELFIFLLSTRAGGLGINLTAADTVIFYDSDWNPTIDSQAMDRAHRLGQTKQVTVYRLITRGTIEERILSRAKQKEEVQKVVISGGDYKQGTTDNLQFQSAKGSGGRDVVSWLLEDDAQASEVEKRLGAITPAKGKSSKSSKEKKAITMDELYHEGEAEFRDTGANSPEDNLSEFGGSTAAKSVQSKSKKAKRKKIEEL